VNIRDRIKELRRVPANELRPNPRNWRTHPEKQLNAIRGVLAEVGFAGAELARELEDGTLELIDGHARAEVAGTAEVPVLVLDVNEAEANKILATFDPIGAMADSDAAKLDAVLRDVETANEDLSQMIADLANEAGLYLDDGTSEIEEDEVPEPPADPITKPGDLWLLGRHRLLCGDSTSKSEVTYLMNGKKAGMLFTDPPYGVSYEGGHNEKKREKLKNDELSDESLSDLFYQPLNIAINFTEDDAAFYVWFASGKSIETFAAFAKLPLTLRAVIQWYKVKSGLGAFMSQYIPNCEPCIYAHKAKKAPKWFGPTDEKTVWELPKEKTNEFHPTQKPVALPARAIKNSSHSADIVLDLFVGSGSTLIAAEQLGRTCYGMELSPQYCDVIVERWQNLTGEKAKRENGTA
jgi:DNA modification methylase